jgi:hypothetical protein
MIDVACNPNSNKKEEVEDPPFLPLRFGKISARLARTRTRAHVTSALKSLYLDYGNRPQSE